MRPATFSVKRALEFPIFIRSADFELNKAFGMTLFVDPRRPEVCL